MFIINFEDGTAKEEYKTIKGNWKVNNFQIFLDNKGAFVSTKNGIVYLNEKNSYSL
jgi:hypothetical protein